MSRLRAANGAAARLRQSKNRLETNRFHGRGVLRVPPGVCATVDAWWTPSWLRSWRPHVRGSVRGRIRPLNPISSGPRKSRAGPGGWSGRSVRLVARKRLLGELTSVGLTERLPCGRYRLGWRTLGLARTKLATTGYREEITPTARRLASHFGETVHITAWERGRVLYVASERPPDGVAAPAEPVAAQLTPPGAVLLAERAGGAGSGLEPGELERTPPTRVRGWGSARPRRGGLRRRSGTHERRAGDRCPRAVRPA